MGERLAPIDREIILLIPALRAFARSLAKDPVEADDLVQESLTKALANIRQYTPGTNLRAWMYTIQRNTFYTNHHKRSREPVLAVEDLPGAYTRATQIWSLKLKAVDEALQQLPVDQREAVMLVGGAGMSYEEASEICDCAIGTIKSRVSRGRAALLQHLDSDDEADFLEDAEQAVAQPSVGGSASGT